MEDCFEGSGGLVYPIVWYAIYHFRQTSTFFESQDMSTIVISKGKDERRRKMNATAESDSFRDNVKKTQFLHLLK